MAKEPKATEKKEEAPTGGRKKMILLIAAVIVLAFGVGAVAYILGAKSASATGEAPVKEAAAEAPDAKVEQGPLLPLDSFIVNIMDGQETRYLKASITLELTNQKVSEEISQRGARIRDAVLLLIGSRSFDELRDLQGKLQLRADLIDSINGFLTTGKVTKVYFTDFVVQ